MIIKKNKSNQNELLIRLNKYIANSGICSRREADKLIENGEITVNDKIISTLGTKVSQNDIVKHKGKAIICQNKVYVLLNKPKGYISTVSDEKDRKTVIDIVKDATSERIYPVGRLDRNTSGLLLLTNDGDLTKHLTHPSSKVSKIYAVELDSNLKAHHFDMISSNEIVLEDGPIDIDEIAYIEKNIFNKLGIKLHSGKNRILRRIFEHLGYKVVKLDRVFFAGLTKKDLPRGKYRLLNENEVRLLKNNLKIK